MRWLIGWQGSRLTRSRGGLVLVADVLVWSCCDPVYIHIPMYRRTVVLVALFSFCSFCLAPRLYLSSFLSCLFFLFLSPLCIFHLGLDLLFSPKPFLVCLFFCFFLFVSFSFSVLLVVPPCGIRTRVVASVAVVFSLRPRNTYLSR